MTSTEQRVALVIMDGVGIAEPGDGNAFATAETPTLDSLFSEHPYTELEAAGASVGLPTGYMGNSEVGHLHIGAGRTVPQDLVRINEAIKDGSFFEKEALQVVLETVREHDSTVHLMGIASDGGVHGHINHLCALIEFFGDNGVDVVTHAVLDGRDVAPNSAEQYLEQIEHTAERAGTGHVGSFMGRFYAMDRDENWERTEAAYRALIAGEGRNTHSISEGLRIAREEDRNDYFVRPTIISDRFSSVGEHDAIVLTNYRKDRARQLTAAFISEDFDAFPQHPPDTVTFLSMNPYKQTFDNPTLFKNITVEPTLGEVISNNGLRQLRLSESQKKAHVTYFFDGQRETTLTGEETKIFPSADVAAYDEKPEMEAERITAYAVERMEEQSHEFILMNYPNGDLVGHSGNTAAAVDAVETIDACISQLVATAEEHGYTVILTADHGNCEKMQENGQMYTAHTLNNVPFCIVHGPEDPLSSGGLANVAPTVLDVLNLSPPAEFTETLIEHE